MLKHLVLLNNHRSLEHLPARPVRAVEGSDQEEGGCEAEAEGGEDCGGEEVEGEDGGGGDGETAGPGGGATDQRGQQPECGQQQQQACQPVRRQED